MKDLISSLLWKMALPAIIFVGILIYFFACDGEKSYNGAYLRDQENINWAANYTRKYIDSTDIVTKVVFIPKANSGVTSYAGKMEIYLYEIDNDTLMLFSSPLLSKERVDGVHRESDSRITNSDRAIKKENGIPYSKIDFSKIAEYIKEGGEFVVAKGKEKDEPLFFSGVGKYTLNLNKDPKLITHEFSIESKDTTKSSRNMVYYDEFKFKVDSEGKVIPTR